MAQYINLIDFILFPFVFLLIFRISVILKNRHFKKGHPLRPYFVPALLLKIFGSVAFAVVYQYYYGYGDTFGFYEMGRFFTQIVTDNPTDFLKVYFSGDDPYYISKSYVYNFDYLYNHHIATVIVARFSSFIGLFTFNNYLFITIGFSILSFSGLWKLFRMFATMYPTLVRPLAFAILFVPSVIFWGSGLLKDSLTLGAIGWLTFACWSLFILKKRIKSSILVVVLTVWILFQIKSYILLSFLPTIFIWLSAVYYNKISNRSLRILLWPLFIALIFFAAVQVNNMISEDRNELSYENLTNTALMIGTTLQQFEAGSTYNLGVFSASLSDIILRSPLAIVTTLFRPFIWEVKNVVMLISAIESLVVLILTVWVLVKVGITKFFKILFSKSIVAFCFLFSMVFSVGVAISSGNFGTLVRYKLPALPFYFICLLLIYHYSGQHMVAKQARERRKTKPRALQPSFS